MLILESQWNSIFPLWLAFSQWQLHIWKNFFPFNYGLSWYACRSAARCWSGLLRSPWALWKSTCQNKRVALSLWDCVSQCCLFLFYSGRATGSSWGSKSRDLLFICYLREPALCFELWVHLLLVFHLIMPGLVCSCYTFWCTLFPWVSSCLPVAGWGKTSNWLSDKEM